MKYDHKHEPMCIYPSTYKKLLDTGNSDAVSLFMFYYYTSKYQSTNTVWCTASFAQKGLGIGKDRFRKAKALLMGLGYIKDKQDKSDGGLFGKSYIELSLVISPVGGFPPDRQPPTREQDTNAYTNKENAYTSNKTESNKKKPSMEIGEVIAYLNTATGCNYRPNTAKYQTLIATLLREKFTVQDMKDVIDHKNADPYFVDNGYVRPTTLFKLEKFQEYLQDARKSSRTAEFIKKKEMAKYNYQGDIDER